MELTQSVEVVNKLREKYVFTHQLYREGAHLLHYSYDCTHQAIVDGVSAYMTPRPRILDEYQHLVCKYVDQFCEKYMPPTISQILWEDVAKALDLSTSAGVLHFGKTKQEFLSPGWEAVAHHMKWWSHQPKDVYPCKLATKPKCHETGKDKVRLIWVYPVEQTLYEASVALPLYAYFKKLDGCPITFGKHVIPRLSALSGSGKRYTITLDWQSFDQTVPSFIIARIFSQIGSRIQMLSQFKDTARHWQHKVTNYFINTPLLLEDGSVICKHSGIPSGSPFTQIVGSIVNYAVVQTILHLLNIAPVAHLVLGDDSIVSVECIPTKALFVEMSKIARKVSTMVLNVNKCGIGNPGTISFLGYEFYFGVLRPNLRKFLFKLFCSYRQMTYREWYARLVMLYAIGGWAVNEYEIFLKNCNPQQLQEEDIDKNLRAKLKYVLGMPADTTNLVQYFNYVYAVTTSPEAMSRLPRPVIVNIVRKLGSLSTFF